MNTTLENLSEKKYVSLLVRLQSLGKVAIAFSGGVDSTFLLFAAKEAIGPQNVLALTADTQLLPREDLNRAVFLAAALGVEHKLVKLNVYSVDDIAANGPNRCYYCKKAVFTALKQTAQLCDIEVLLDGSNVDDRGDYRPGKKAAAELAIVSPLCDVELSKSEIRLLSKEAGLSTADLPAYACLATRILTGTPLNSDTISKIEYAEANLHKAGFLEVRVRVHGDCARIELPMELLEAAIKEKKLIVDAIKPAGFRYVSLDLEGYRMGSSNKEVTGGQ